MPPQGRDLREPLLTLDRPVPPEPARRDPPRPAAASARLVPAHSPSVTGGGHVFFTEYVSAMPDASQHSQRRRADATGDDSDDSDEVDASASYAAGTTCVGVLRLAASYTASDVQKRPRNWCIGCVSTAIVVLVVGLVLLGISKGPVVFLRFAELQVGEMDALILAEGSVPFVNYTELEPKLARSQRTSGSSPRWLIKGQFGDAEDRTKPAAVTNVLIVDSGHEKTVGIGRGYDYRQIGYAEAQVLESVLRFTELRANIGQRSRLFVDIAGVLKQQGIAIPSFIDPPAPVNPPLNATAIAAAAAALRPFVPGVPNATAENITTFIDAFNAFQQGIPGVELFDVIEPTLEFTVADGFPTALGKYPAPLGNMVIVDYHRLLRQLLAQTCYDSARSPFRLVIPSGGPVITALPSPQDLQETYKLKDYALLVVAMLRSRFTTYYKTSEDRDFDFIQWSNDVFYAVGVDFGGSAQYPIALALTALDGFGRFVNSILQVTAAIVAILGAILVYTLLLTNSEERGFEVAMLRAQGMSKVQLLVLMFAQVLAFVIPGAACGIACLLALNAIIEVVLATYTLAPAETARISVDAVVIPLAVGVLVPLVGNTGPIRNVFKQSLRDALDLYRNKASETTVVATKLAELGMDPFTVMVAWLLVIGGFLIYYMVPLAFLFNELWLFFVVMNVILLGMLFGLCLMAHTVQAPLERGFLWLLLWGKEKQLQPLIVKNFTAHSERNSKGFMMFTMSVASVVFGGVLFTLLATSITQTVMVVTGADVTVDSLDFDTPINRTLVDEFLTNHKGTEVLSWSYETFPLFSYAQIVERTQYGNSIGFPYSTQDFVALSENFLDTAFPQFVLVEDLQDGIAYGTSATGAVDIIRSMYTADAVTQLAPVGPLFTGYPPNATRPNVETKYGIVMPAVSSSAATKVLGLTAGAFGSLTFKYRIGRGANSQREVKTLFLSTVRALVRRWPGSIRINPIPFSFGRSPTFVTIPRFQNLLDANEIDFPLGGGDGAFAYPPDGSRTVFYRKLYVRLHPSVTGVARTDFVNLLQSRVDPYYHLTTDTAGIVESVESVAQGIVAFFYGFSFVAMVLNTLMLWLVFVSNVQLNAWSFAVLRSLGFTTAQLTRAFVYECVSLVLAAVLTGTIIGAVVAFTLILQINIFLQLPFQFDFPAGLFGFLLLLSLGAAVLGPSVPARAISGRPIANVLKGGK